MTIIANPIYDAVFKYLMEDEKVAKILLSALLKKEILELEIRRHEYSSVQQDKIALFRIDFSARVRDADGTVNLILIELQKTWLPTETLRFRQYLGTQYLDKMNMIKEEDVPYGMPIVTIYILGHALGDLTEPVIYVRRRYLDYDDRVICGTNPFIESLTHDAVIVLLPFLKGRTRNRLERLLSVFDQDYRMENEHLLELPEDDFSGDEQAIVTRLLKAAVSPQVRRDMEIEDEILSEIEARDTVIMLKDKMIEQREQTIEQREQTIVEREQTIVEKNQTIVRKNQTIVEKDQMIVEKDQMIEKKEQVIEEKDQILEKKEQIIEEKDQILEKKEQIIEEKIQIIEEKDQMLRSMITILCQGGLTPVDIAGKLSLPLEQIQRFM